MVDNEFPIIERDGINYVDYFGEWVICETLSEAKKLSSMLNSASNFGEAKARSKIKKALGL